MKSIGLRLKEARLAKNLKQEELAERIGAKYRSISTWENGTAKPDCLTILRICEVLSISPNIKSIKNLQSLASVLALIAR